jgi:hypothetical protein
MIERNKLEITRSNMVFPQDNDKFINAARQLIDTPYQHQGRLPGTAVDCLGVVILAAQGAGWLPDDWEDIIDYKPNTPDLLERLLEYGVVQNFPEIGAIATLVNRPTHQKVRHLGIVADWRGERTLIHASARAGRCVEQPLKEFESQIICYIRLQINKQIRNHCVFNE